MLCEYYAITMTVHTDCVMPVLLLRYQINVVATEWSV